MYEMCVQKKRITELKFSCEIHNCLPRKLILKIILLLKFLVIRNTHLACRL